MLSLISLIQTAERTTTAQTRAQRLKCWSLSRGKRAFDVAIACAVMAVFSLPMLLIAICIRLTSTGPALFAQRRVGRDGRLFKIYKFRSMTFSARRKGAGLTTAGDARVTPIGRQLRLLKLDELPQFYNILRGDMSLVGPRPKLPEYAEQQNFVYRPGLTGAASLAFRREEEILAQVHTHEVESFYQHRIKPLKAKLDERYMAQATFLSDLRLIGSTFLASVMPHNYPALRYHDLHEPVNPKRQRGDEGQLVAHFHSAGIDRSFVQRGSDQA